LAAQFERLADLSGDEIEAVFEPLSWIAETTNTRAASVSSMATAIPRAERRARSAKGPDWNLRMIIIMAINLREEGPRLLEC